MAGGTRKVKSNPVARVAWCSEADIMTGSSVPEAMLPAIDTVVE